MSDRMDELGRARGRITFLLGKATDRVKELTMTQIEIQRNYPIGARISDTFQALLRENEHETGYAAGLSRALYEIDRAVAEENGNEKA